MLETSKPVIDATAAYALLMDVTSGRLDYRYEVRPVAGWETAPEDDKSYYERCDYVRNGAPSCIVGHALYHAGVPTELLMILDGDPDRVGGISAFNISDDRRERHLGDIEFPVSITDGAAHVFSAAQQAQDEGISWGEALREARERLASLRKNGVR